MNSARLLMYIPAQTVTSCIDCPEPGCSMFCTCVESPANKLGDDLCTGVAASRQTGDAYVTPSKTKQAHGPVHVFSRHHIFACSRNSDTSWVERWQDTDVNSDETSECHKTRHTSAPSARQRIETRTDATMNHLYSCFVVPGPR